MERTHKRRKQARIMFILISCIWWYEHSKRIRAEENMQRRRTFCLIMTCIIYHQLKKRHPIHNRLRDISDDAIWGGRDVFDIMRHHQYEFF